MNAWRPALEWLAQFLLDAAELFPSMHQYGAFTPAPYQITIEHQYPLPEDENDEKQMDLSEVSNRARSVRSYLMKWGGPDCKGLDGDEADAELTQIVKEQRMMEDSFLAEDE